MPIMVTFADRTDQSLVLAIFRNADVVQDLPIVIAPFLAIEIF